MMVTATLMKILGPSIPKKKKNGETKESTGSPNQT